MESAPGIEVPVDAAHRAVPIDDAGRPNIAHPSVVALETQDADPRLERPPRERVLRRRNAHGHGLETRDRVGDGGERALRRHGLLAPVVAAHGPEHPAATMRLELPGHAKAVGRGSRGDRFAHEPEFSMTRDSSEATRRTGLARSTW